MIGYKCTIFLEWCKSKSLLANNYVNSTDNHGTTSLINAGIHSLKVFPANACMDNNLLEGIQTGYGDLQPVQRSVVTPNEVESIGIPMTASSSSQPFIFIAKREDDKSHSRVFPVSSSSPKRKCQSKLRLNEKQRWLPKPSYKKKRMISVTDSETDSTPVNAKLSQNISIEKGIH